MGIDLLQVCSDIKDTLEAASGIVKAQSIEDLTEGYEDLPLLQVYFESGETDTMTGGDRSTFRAGTRVSDTLVYADVICTQRSHLDQDMTKIAEMLAAVEEVLEEQQVKPYFGNASIKGFSWSWRRVNFDRGEQGITYPGLRFSINVKVF